MNVKLNTQVKCHGCNWSGFGKTICATCDKVYSDNIRPTIPSTNMEPSVQHALDGKKQVCSVHPRCSISVHSKRKRLADPDGISAKAVIDGLRACGILVDDSAKYVKEVRFSQEIGEPEETTVSIEFEEIGCNR